MKTMKSLILAAALGLCSLSVASATTYKMVLAAPTVAGTAHLDPGAYELNVNGRFATFTNIRTNQRVIVLVQVGSDADLHNRTTVSMKDENGAQRIESIQLEDSPNTLEF
jgi:hypothetical protein